MRCEKCKKQFKKEDLAYCGGKEVCQRCFSKNQYNMKIKNPRKRILGNKVCYLCGSTLHHYNRTGYCRICHIKLGTREINRLNEKRHEDSLKSQNGGVLN